MTLPTTDRAEQVAPMAPLAPSATDRLTRDRYTWLAYILLGYFAYLQASLGPIMPFLRKDLHLDHTVGSLHASAYSLGMLLAGLVGDRLARRFGRRRVFWGGAFGMALGATFLALGRASVLTIGAALLMGSLGALLLILIQSTLADHHGPRQTVALTEANVSAVLCASFAPLLVGAFQASGIGWRGALYLPVVVVAVLAFTGRRVALPTQVAAASPVPAIRVRSGARAADVATRALPRVFWAYWVLMLFCVAAEGSVIIWTADFLHDVGGLSVVNAATTVGIFFGAELVGRLFGAWLTRKKDSRALLVAALVLTLAGFPLLWLAPLAPIRVLGLFITGLGIANIFPLTLATATGTSPRQADMASARIALAVGIGSLAAPLLIGRLADTFGIQYAFGVIPIFVLLALATIILAGRLRFAV